MLLPILRWQNYESTNITETSHPTVTAQSDQALLNLKWDGTLDGDIVHVNNNKATFTDDQMKETFPSQASKLNPVDGLSLSALDSLGRSQQGNFVASKSAISKVTKRPDRIPYTVRPSGWFINDRYDGTKWVGGYHDNPNVKLGNGMQALWNKSHIVGYQFFGLPTMVTENMITGTRVENAYPGSCPKMIFAMLSKTIQLLRSSTVTPLYVGNERLARGVHYMAKSVEDNGKH